MYKIEELNNHLELLPNKAFRTELVNEVEDAFKNCVNIKLLARMCLRLSGKMDYTFLHLQVGYTPINVEDYESSENRNRVVYTEDLANKLTLSALKESIKDTIYTAFKLDGSYKMPHSDKSTHVIVLIDGIECLGEDFIKELNDNVYYCQITALDYKGVEVVVEKLLNENATLSVEETKVALAIDKRVSEAKITYEIKDLNKVDKDYIGTLVVDDIVDILVNQPVVVKAIFDMFDLNLERMTIQEDCIYTESMDIDGAKYRDKKLAYALLVLLTTALNSKYSEIIVDFQGFDTVFGVLTKYTNFINKNVVVYTQNTDIAMFLHYRLGKFFINVK